VVQDIFLTETARLADVVLPAAAFAEKRGTFTNTERRVQMVRPAVKPPGEAKADWLILQELASRLGMKWHYETPEDIFEEIALLTPSYAGISYRRLEEEGGLQWPCPDSGHPGTPYLHEGKFSRGKGLFTPVEYRPPAEQPDEQYPLLLTTGRNLFHYHTGTMTRRSNGINAFKPEETVQISPDDASRLGIDEGDLVEIASRRGNLKARAAVTEQVPAGMIFMTFHFHETPANLLTNNAVDPVAKIPEFKVCAVKVEKISP